MSTRKKPGLCLMAVISLIMVLASSQAGAASESQSESSVMFYSASPVYPLLSIAGSAMQGSEGIARNMPQHLRRQMEESLQKFTTPKTGRVLSKSTYRCRPKHYHRGYEFRALAGQYIGLWLWRYHQQVAYCTNGSVVTYFYRVRWFDIGSVTPYVDWKAWQFVNHVDSNCGGEHCAKKPYRAWERMAYTKGEFKVCLAFGNVCNTAFAQIWISVFGDGTVISKATG